MEQAGYHLLLDTIEILIGHNRNLSCACDTVVFSTNSRRHFYYIWRLL